MSSISIEQLHYTRVAAGYKAALSNPRISAAAKEHAHQQLELLDGFNDEQKAEHNNRVLGGFKATLHNPNTSAEAKQHAREMLEAAGFDVGEIGTQGGESPSSAKDDQHAHRVLAGYKAALHNPRTSEEAKAHARQVLEKEGAEF